jgi:hypothetical protein
MIDFGCHLALSNLHPTLSPEIPLDPAVLLDDAGDIAAAVLLKRRCPRDKGETYAVVDHGEPARCQREALAVGAGDLVSAGRRCVGQPCFRRQPGAGGVKLTAPQSGEEAGLRDDVWPHAAGETFGNPTSVSPC